MKPVRLLALIEATTVTGPAKNLLQFAQLTQDVEVNIAAFHRPGDSEVFRQAAARVNVPVHLIEEKGRFDRSVVPALRDLYRRLKPDLLQTHAVKSHVIARVSGLRPWVAFHHGYTWPDLRARIYNQADRWSLPQADTVVTVSQPFSAELQRMGMRPERIRVVHNAVSGGWGQGGDRASLRAQLCASLGIDSSRKIVMIVGRLSLEKDHLTLLEAVRGLAGTHVLIVGDGPERRRIEAWLHSAGQQESVTLTGQVPSAEPYYAAADIAVLSSLTEGSPNALLEAMAAGVPVVATRVGGIPEIVADGESALLVRPRDREAMAAAIGRLLREEGLPSRLATRAREIVKENHSPEGRTLQIGSIYRSLLENTGAGNAG